MANSKQQRLASLIAHGVYLTAQRWDIENKIEQIVGHEIDDFVNDLWGPLACACDNPSPSDVMDNAKHLLDSNAKLTEDDN